MGEERGRRRGRRRGRGRREEPPAAPDPQQQGEARQPIEESDAPGVLLFRLRLWGGQSRRDREKRGDQAPRPKERAREKTAAAAATSDVAPLGFWRRTRARPHRERPLPSRGPGRWWRRLTGFYFPPWVPVVAIIVVVFAILGLLFFTREAAGAPRIGRDHWHSTYQIIICGNRQPSLREWESGVQTHGDGVIHLHPFLPQEEGAGSRLDKWFEQANRFLGKWDISGDSITLGDGTRYKNGDLCDDGRPGKLQVLVNGEPQDNFLRYIPKDGDRLRIVFGPEESEPVRQEDRTVIAEDQATRTVELEVTDDGSEASTAFLPASIDVNAGETVKLSVKNSGVISHGVRLAGPDGQYDTSDDYVSNPEIIQPGTEGVIIVRFDEPGEFEFRDVTILQATGTIVVLAQEESEPSGEPEPAEEVDVAFDVEMGDNFFGPAELEVEAGQAFRINLTNSGEFVHNLHIAGPDDEFESDDDIESDPSFQGSGETGVLVAQIDKPGIYRFRCDFHPTDMVGTIAVR